MNATGRNVTGTPPDSVCVIAGRPGAAPGLGTLTHLAARCREALTVRPRRRGGSGAGQPAAAGRGHLVDHVRRTAVPHGTGQQEVVARLAALELPGDPWELAALAVLGADEHHLVLRARDYALREDVLPLLLFPEAALGAYGGSPGSAPGRSPEPAPRRSPEPAPGRSPEVAFHRRAASPLRPAPPHHR
ncbi:hypothetical protein [Streptomyces indicus]|uniref:Uncharacterized protein n=1 Tax=Streptomyces indicus TaxID=417292 RepID=A0A1G9AXM4_9ACTN|nr:hypothetical protein [Streptomyces indicus]SDK31365.1 hypothetical protein SAMN05421806_106180 [Streptomyces indicus]